MPYSGFLFEQLVETTFLRLFGGLLQDVVAADSHAGSFTIRELDPALGFGVIRTTSLPTNCQTGSKMQDVR
ncbi:MAG: hypothetical protein OXN17_16030 [Candidatus Poribacteria bacterium]|nr:hypothetical protein [Candidatus Poribacteria bacterium]MDE0506513.1 hypothetical protein [Candidatus Poribacteria bacterium]